MRQRFDVGRVNRHHRIEEKREVDSLRFDRDLERVAVTVERPGPFDGSDVDRFFVRASQEAVANRSVWSLVDNLDSAFRDWPDGNDVDDKCWFNAAQIVADRDFFELHQST